MAVKKTQNNKNMLSLPVKYDMNHVKISAPNMKCTTLKYADRSL